MSAADVAQARAEATALADLLAAIEALDPADRPAAIARAREALHRLSATREEPIDLVRWVPAEKVEANAYNPNSVAKNEMRLLYTSIKHDGYTQPIVTLYDYERDRYVIVDGFHRFLTLRSNADIRERTGGLLPVVVIDKPLAERMASTVRHNRARGKHSITGMSNLVFSMLDDGMNDSEVCAALGMEPEELLRLKYVTGFAKLFEGTAYKRAWETKRQIKLRKAWEAENAEANPDA